MTLKSHKRTYFIFLPVCPKISHCLHRKCTNIYDNHCEYCDGEIIDKRYWRAYIRRRENSYKTCERKLTAIIKQHY